MSDVVVYNDGEIELGVSVENETVWLNRNQIAQLFGRDVKTIGKHINNVFKEGELESFSVVANFATTATDGKIYSVEHYNLDVIISVGYRVKSQKGVRFRQWATSVLKSYITNGFVINSEKITNERFVSLENSVNNLSSKLENIEKRVIDNRIQPKEGIFYDGQIYDAYAFVNELIRGAKRSIVLFDNYIDDSVLTIFSQNQEVLIKIFTKNIDKKLELDIEKYNAQYKPLIIEKFELSHDRFLIIDDDIYHIGASLKDLGKKWFAFSKMDKEAVEILGRV